MSDYLLKDVRRLKLFAPGNMIEINSSVKIDKVDNIIIDEMNAPKIV